MLFRHQLKTAFTGLKTNKSRSVLTILGIVIGITAIILIMSLGQGAQKLILSQVEGLGSNTIAIIPGREPKGPSDFANIFLDSLKERDLEILKSKSNLPYARDIMPVVFGPARLSYGSETYQSTVFGGGSAEQENLIARMFDLETETGEFFGASDVQSKSSVAIIGSKVKKELFGNFSALGEKVKIGNHSFRVVGTLPSKGQVSFFNFDEMVIVPYTTAGQYILGRKHFDRIIVTAEDETKIDQTVRDITSALRQSHNITDPSKDDFFVETQADLAERLGTITSVLTAFLTAVASISLFVGGIGIMNIMLVSVTERTREIGLRKAVGATMKDILTQFLLESIILTLVGGVIGIIAGTTLSFVLSLILSAQLGNAWEFTFPVQAAVLGLVVSASVGLVFGIYPARIASKKSPIEALRYE
ncbi:MAG: ABC transporter permease [bacterium]|nr:ABC transporter permease [bacterium]